jgi:tetratricopeptide (TPR) repeat protein
MRLMALWSWTLALLVAPSVVAQSEERLSWERYIELVRHYREGTVDWASARHLLAQRTRLQSIARNLNSFPLPTRDLKAIVLLHTETAALYLDPDPGVERTRDLQMEVAESVLPLVKEESFSRRWRLAAGYFYQSVLSPAQAFYHLDILHELTPHDVEILLAMGMVHETLGAFELSKVPRWTHSNPTFTQSGLERRLVADMRKTGRQRLDEAVGWYSKATRQDVPSAMAHLRRGHCYALLRRGAEALEDLTRAADLSQTSYERGLSSLFLGQLHRDAGNLDEAVAQYRMAVANLPEWQVGFLGLSEALGAAGEREESRATLEKGLRVSVRANDPRGGLWQYYLRMDGFSDVVNELRTQVLP